MKKSIKRIMALTIIGATLLTILPIGASAEWRQNTNNTWSYTDETGNVMKDSWIAIEGKEYYLGYDGIMKTNGWIKDVNGKWFYFNADGIMAKDTTINGYKLGIDGARIQNITQTTIQTNNIFPIQIPSTWQKIGDYGYIINGRTAIVYEPKYLQGYSYEKALSDIGLNIINDKSNSNIKTEYKKYNGYNAMRYEYLSTDTNGKIQKNCFVVIVTTDTLYGFMVQGENNWGFDIDELDLELALSINFKV